MRDGNTALARRLHEDVVSGKSGLGKPNLVCYSTVVDSLCKDGLVDDAKNLFLEMKGKGISPDVVVYSSLIQGMCSSDK